MNFPSSLFPLPFLLAIDAAMVLALLWLIRRIDWREAAAAIHPWLGATVLVMVLWTMKYDARPGLSYHLLGMTLLTLMMGPARALVAAALVAAASCASAGGDWPALGLNWLGSGVLPVVLTWLVLRLTQRSLPANYFIYLFLNAFLAGGLAMALAGSAGVVLLGALAVYPWSGLLADALPYYLLLAWSEAFLSGLLTAIMVVYRPGWVCTFDDRRYLDTH